MVVGAPGGAGRDGAAAGTAGGAVAGIRETAGAGSGAAGAAGVSTPGVGKLGAEPGTRPVEPMASAGRKAKAVPHTGPRGASFEPSPAERLLA